METNKEKKFWNKKKVLVTGHTGFKGSWLCIWLEKLGAEVIGYALDPKEAEDNYNLTGIGKKIIDLRGDIRDREALQAAFDQYKPEIVFHLAAQPLVIESYHNPYDTYEINVMGTLNVLEAIRQTPSVSTAIFITTDKCYENKETLCGYKETDAFGGYDPYSSSKACDEILISSYRNSFFPIEQYEKHKKAIASVRAGNVIGGGDWAENRILPDCIRAVEKNEPIKIRKRYAIRPWQHVLEPLWGYLMLAEKLYMEPDIYSGGWNFGPEQDAIWTVWDVAECVVKNYQKGSLMDATNPEAVHEAGKLVLNIEKAKNLLGWQPRLRVEEAVEWTVRWYKDRMKQSPYEICIEQMEAYEKLGNIN